MAMETKIVGLENHVSIHNGAYLPRTRAHVPAPELQVALILVAPVMVQVEERVHATREAAATIAIEIAVEICMDFQIPTCAQINQCGRRLE